jgi:hypothetical protein
MLDIYILNLASQAPGQFFSQGYTAVAAARAADCYVMVCLALFQDVRP